MFFGDIFLFHIFIIPNLLRVGYAIIKVLINAVPIIQSFCESKARYIALDATNKSVVWSSSDESVATVSRGEVKGLKEGTVVITATAKNNEEIKASITLTFEKADQPIVSGEWADMPFTTHAEYMTAEKDSKLKVKGVVTHISPAKDGKVTYTLQDGTEGYYYINLIDSSVARPPNA